MRLFETFRHSSQLNQWFRENRNALPALFTISNRYDYQNVLFWNRIVIRVLKCGELLLTVSLPIAKLGNQNLLLLFCSFPSEFETHVVLKPFMVLQEIFMKLEEICPAQKS